jgi:hypothetical protein
MLDVGDAMHIRELIRPDGRHLTPYRNPPILDEFAAPKPFLEGQVWEDSA